jgi:hypothetical protein
LTDTKDPRWRYGGPRDPDLTKVRVREYGRSDPWGSRPQVIHTVTCGRELAEIPYIKQELASPNSRLEFQPYCHDYPSTQSDRVFEYSVIVFSKRFPEGVLLAFAEDHVPLDPPG